MAAKTNAARLFDAAGKEYRIHSYDGADGLIDGVSVAKSAAKNRSGSSRRW